MKSLISVLALACVALGAQAQSKMYKCTGDGRTVYQQTACSAAASAASAPAAASAAAATKAADKATPERPERTRRSADTSSAKPASADTAGRLAGSRP